MSHRVRTDCPRDCPDACGIVAEVSEDCIVRLAGDREHPVTQGFLCARTSKFLARQYSPERLRAPLVRRGGSLEPSTWDEALDLCAERLRAIASESGPRAILHYRGGGSLGILKGLVDLLFARFGPVTTVRGSVCDGAGIAAQQTDFGDADSNDWFDLLHAKTIILWGKNPTVSSPHLLPILRQARSAGTRIVLIDPVRHKAASSCDLVVQPRPGGDLALALGVGRLLWELGAIHPDAAQWCEGLGEYRALVHSRSIAQWSADAGVSAEDMVSVAEPYARGKPSTILVGWGMQRRTNGTSIVRAIDALGLVTGNVGIEGGSVSFYFKRRGAFDLSALEPRGDAARTVREARLGRDLLEAREPPIRAAWISCANPAAMLPDAATVSHALSSLDLCVVVDGFLTDTARLASVVLPCATFLEDDDLVGAYGHHYLAELRPVVAPPEGVLTDREVVVALAARLGLADIVGGSVEQWKQRLLPRSTLERLRSGPVRSEASPTIAFAGRRFPTPSGKARLLGAVPDSAVRARAPDTEFPLQLAALSVPEAQCSQWAVTEPSDPLVARVHPCEGTALANGTRAWLVSRQGRIQVTVRWDETVRPGLVVVPKGGSQSLGRCANTLVAPRLTDGGEGAALYEEPVRLELA